MNKDKCLQYNLSVSQKMSDLNLRKVLFIGGSCTSGSCSVPLEEWAFHLIYEYYILTIGKLERKDTWKGGDTSHPSLTVVTFDPIRLLFGKFSCRQKDFFFPQSCVLWLFEWYLTLQHYKKAPIPRTLHYLLLLVSSCRCSLETGECLTEPRGNHPSARLPSSQTEK